MCVYFYISQALYAYSLYAYISLAIAVHFIPIFINKALFKDERTKQKQMQTSIVYILIDVTN